MYQSFITVLKIREIQTIDALNAKQDIIFPKITGVVKTGTIGTRMQTPVLQLPN